MRSFALPTLLACSLGLAAVPPVAFAAASTTVAAPDEQPRVGRVFIDTAALGDAGPVIAGRATRVAQKAFEAESVAPTDLPAGPELRVILQFRDAGGYAVRYEVVYDGDVTDDGSFECQLCTEDELMKKIEGLARQQAPMMVVPVEDEGGDEGGEDDGGDDGGGEDDGGTTEPEGPKEDPGKMQAMGKAGIGLLAAGGASLIAGVVLVVIPPAARVGPDGLPEIRATREFGYGFLGGGAALAITGGVLLALDRKKAKERRAAAGQVSVVPWFRGDGAGLGVSGRF